MSKKLIIGMKTLPGEPQDGSGKVCIHLFVRDETGPFVEPCVMQSNTKVTEENSKKKTIIKATRGRLACDRKRLVAPIIKDGVTNITLRSGEPRAVNCPKCMASPDYIRMMKAITDNK